MLKGPIGIRNHQMDKRGTRRRANDLRTFCAEAVLIAFVPIDQNVEAFVVAPQSDQRVVLDARLPTQRNDGARESPRGQTLEARR